MFVAALKGIKAHIQDIPQNFKDMFSVPPSVKTFLIKLFKELLYPLAAATGVGFNVPEDSVTAKALKVVKIGKTIVKAFVYFAAVFAVNWYFMLSIFPYLGKLAVNHLASVAVGHPLAWTNVFISVFQNTAHKFLFLLDNLPSFGIGGMLSQGFAFCSTYVPFWNYLSHYIPTTPYSLLSSGIGLILFSNVKEMWNEQKKLVNQDISELESKSKREPGNVDLKSEVEGIKNRRPAYAYSWFYVKSVAKRATAESNKTAPMYVLTAFFLPVFAFTVFCALGVTPAAALAQANWFSIAAWPYAALSVLGALQTSVTWGQEVLSPKDHNKERAEQAALGDAATSVTSSNTPGSTNSPSPVVFSPPTQAQAQAQAQAQPPEVIAEIAAKAQALKERKERAALFADAAERRLSATALLPAGARPLVFSSAPGQQPLQQPPVPGENQVNQPSGSNQQPRV